MVEFFNDSGTQLTAWHIPWGIAGIILPRIWIMDLPGSFGFGSYEDAMEFLEPQVVLLHGADFAGGYDTWEFFRYGIGSLGG